jgi:hypothetical protein
VLGVLILIVLRESCRQQCGDNARQSAEHSHANVTVFTSSWTVLSASIHLRAVPSGFLHGALEVL